MNVCKWMNGNQGVAENTSQKDGKDIDSEEKKATNRTEKEMTSCTKCLQSRGRHIEHYRSTDNISGPKYVGEERRRKEKAGCNFKLSQRG